LGGAGERKRERDGMGKGWIGVELFELQKPRFSSKIKSALGERNRKNNKGGGGKEKVALMQKGSGMLANTEKLGVG